MFKKKWKAMTTIELSYREGRGCHGVGRARQDKIKSVKSSLGKTERTLGCVKGATNIYIYINLLYCCVGESNCCAVQKAVGCSRCTREGTLRQSKYRACKNKDCSSYVYWTVHHIDSPKIDQLDVTRFIISLFTAQHVSNVSTSILRSLRLICQVISWVLVLWFDVCWCYGVVRLGWCGILMQDEAALQPA